MSTESSEAADRLVLNRVTAEVALAVATFAFGALVVQGSLEFGIAWSASGPSAGSFPGSISGTVICLASLVNLVQAVRRPGAVHRAPLLASAQVRRIFAFVGPMALFVAAAYFSGSTSRSAVYLAAVMVGAGPIQGLAGRRTGLAAALSSMSCWSAGSRFRCSRARSKPPSASTDAATRGSPWTTSHRWLTGSRSR